MACEVIGRAGLKGCGWSMSLTRLDAQKNMAHVLSEREIGAEDQMPSDYLEPVKALWQDAGVGKAGIHGGEERR